MANPYAPPTAPVAPLAPQPLPPGVRRFPLEEGPFRKLVARQLWAQRLRLLVALGLAWLLVRAMGTGSDVVDLVVPFYGGVIVVASAVGWLRARRVITEQLGSFEVLLSERVLRRVFVRSPPCEVLRPEVSRIVETKHALWVISESPPSAVGIVRTVVGFEDLRATLATWKPIESRKGFGAWVFGVRHLRRQRPRTLVDGTALAADASLQDELRTVRAVAIDRGAGLGKSRALRRFLVTFALLWVLLMAMFFGIWQFLSPSEPVRRTPRPLTPPPVLSP